MQEDEEQADEDADALGEVVMAIDMSKNGTLGCAYYVAQDEKCYMVGLSLVDYADSLVQALRHGRYAACWC